MDSYSDYLSGISFRLYRPTKRLPGYGKLLALLRRLGTRPEILNTRLPAPAPPELRALCDIPKMSTYAVGALINRGVRLMPAGSCFVNVGVWHGFTLLAGMVGNMSRVCVGVDNFSQFGGPRAEFLARFERYKSENHRFYDMDYEEYFRAEHEGPIGFYVYDGEHSYEHQLKGLQAAEPFFAKGCHVLVDDTNLARVRRATLDFVEGSSKNYEVIFDQPTLMNGHPTFWNGVMVLRLT
jgi:hypothetical protein